MVSKSNASSKTAKDSTPSNKTKMTPSSKDEGRKISPPKPQPRRRRIGGRNSDDGLDMMIEIPKRVSVGNSISANQMLFGFIVVVAGLLKMSADISVMFKPPPGKVYRRFTTSPVNRTQERKEMIRKMISAPLMKILGQHPDFMETGPAELCDLYLSRSSLPASGFAYFAGTNYTEGESIPVEYENTILLKPHSVLSNVELDDSSVLKATRDIGEGEEFFLSWEDHLSNPESSLFANIFPTPEHFKRADDHIREARTQYFGVINYAQLELEAARPKARRGKGSGASSNARWNKKRGQLINAASRQLYKKESVQDIENGLSLWQGVVETYDPIVAKLLPTKAFSLAFYHRQAEADKSLFSSSSLLGSLRNQTVNSLSKFGTCVSFLEWQPVEKAADETDDGNKPEESCASTPSYKQVVKREHGFVEGEILGVVPLLAMEKSAAKDASSCLPLSSLSPNQKVVLCPLGSIYEHNSDRNIANAELVWNNSTMAKMPLGVKSLLTQAAAAPTLSIVEEENQMEILLKKFPLSLSWHIVALKDIGQNETVVIYQPDENAPFLGGL